MADKDGLTVRIAYAAAASSPTVAIVAWPNLDNSTMITLIVFQVLIFILFVMTSFAKGVAKDLQEAWRRRIVKTLLQQFSSFDNKYRTLVLKNQRFIDNKGLGTEGFATPKLDEVFVEASLAFCSPNDLQEGILATQNTDVAERYSIGDFLDHPEAAVLAIVGVPGSGKTTLLKHTARQVCQPRQKRRRRRKQRRTVPILLYLRNHVDTIDSTPSISLPTLLRNTLASLRDDEPSGWFEQRLHDGDCVVLLDGLDEAVGNKNPRSVADWVERQISQYPQNDYVITSRPQGYLAARIEGATGLQVCRFTGDQVTRFVRNWYLAVEQHSSKEMSENAQSRAQSDANDLLNRLNDAPRLYDLTVNPLLLTMIATVHRYQGALPDSRALLYKEICQVMLWRRQEAKKIPTGLDGDKKERLLRGLAFEMMKQRVWVLSRSDILAKIRSDLLRIPQGPTAEDFLADIEANGLLVESGNGFHSFAHHTFQEYLAATHIRDEGRHQILANSVDDIWWQETTLLYAARSNADPIVQACLDSTSVTALSLAFDCVDQNSEIAPELRDSLDRLLTSDTVPERHRFMAGLVTRHLRDPIRTDKNARVCARPITTRLYRLYQQDNQAPELDGPTQSEQYTNAPIIGARGCDAVAFTRWVNDLTDTDVEYRLPNLTEIENTAVQRKLALPLGTRPRSVWLEPENEHGKPQLWTPAEADHPHAVNAKTLADHVKKDFERSTPTLIRFLLLRSITAVRVLARVLDHPLEVTRDRALALARSLDNILTRPRGLDHALNLDLDHAHALAHHLADTHALALARSHGRDLDLDRALDLARATSHGRDLDRALDLAHALGLGHDTALDHDLAQVTGSALSQALTRTFTWRTRSTWPTDFSQAFIEESGINERNFRASPDALAEKVRSGRETLLKIIGTPEDDAPSHSWAHQVVNNFEEIASPILTRHHPLTSVAVTTIRITALCLAVEADIRGRHPVGDTFREIAAGATLLERRAEGLTLPTETIILAVR